MSEPTIGHYASHVKEKSFERVTGGKVLKLEQDWIPVSERLPEVDEQYSKLSGGQRSAPVLIFDGFVLEHAKKCREPQRDAVSIGYFFHTVKDWRTFIQPNGRASVTHWMPLPEPPKS